MNGGSSLCDAETKGKREKEEMKEEKGVVGSERQGGRGGVRGEGP